MIYKQHSLKTWVFLFLINGLVLSAGFLLLIRETLASLETTSLEQTEENLRTFAHSLVTLIPPVPSDVDVFVKNIARNDPGFRITIIAPDGTVAGDSDAEDITKLENHALRPEVKAALEGEEEKAVRHSTVNRKDVMYFAVPFIRDGKHMALRLSMPVDTSVYFSTPLRWRMVVSCTAVFILIMLVSFFVSAHVVKQISALQKAAEQYRSGNFDWKPAVDSPRELEELGEAFETMAGTIKQDIGAITLQRDEFQAVFSGINEALVVFDSKMDVIEYNAAASRLFVTGNKEGPWTLAQFVLNAEMLKLAEQTISGSGNGSEVEARLHPLSGDRDVLVRCMQIRGAEGESRYLLVLTDITRIKKLEQIRTDFVANVSHELKTPVTSLKGFTETLLDGAIDDKVTAHHFLEIMDAQSGRLINIIEDLLTLSRLEQENRPPETAPADLADIVRRSCRSFTGIAEKKQIHIVFHGPDIADGAKGFTADVNAGLISQAVGNIIDNAVKYCPAGSEVNCSIDRLKDPENTGVCIVIEDNGPGIPSVYHERIFERFFRVDKGRSRDAGGTGLGLSITAHIIKLHGGQVRELDRPDGKSGARFEITLPCSE